MDQLNYFSTFLFSMNQACKDKNLYHFIQQLQKVCEFLHSMQTSKAIGSSKVFEEFRGIAKFYNQFREEFIHFCSQSQQFELEKWRQGQKLNFWQDIGFYINSLKQKHIRVDPKLQDLCKKIITKKFIKKSNGEFLIHDGYTNLKLQFENLGLFYPHFELFLEEFHKIHDQQKKIQAILGNYNSDDCPLSQRLYHHRQKIIELTKKSKEAVIIEIGKQSNLQKSEFEDETSINNEGAYEMPEKCKQIYNQNPQSKMHYEILDMLKSNFGLPKDAGIQQLKKQLEINSQRLQRIQKHESTKKQLEDIQSKVKEFEIKAGKALLLVEMYQSMRKNQQQEIKKLQIIKESIDQDLNLKRQSLSQLKNQLQTLEKQIKNLDQIVQAQTEANRKLFQEQKIVKRQIERLQIQNQQQINLLKQFNRKTQVMMLFSGEVINKQVQKEYIYRQVCELNKKLLVKSKLIYSYPLMQGINPHSVIDQISHYIVFMKMEKLDSNGDCYVIAMYSEQPLSKNKKLNSGLGFIASVTNMKAFYLKKTQTYNPRVTEYNDYYLIFGNSELRWKINSNILQSNIGHNFKSFETLNHKNAQVFTGETVELAQIKQYQIFQLFF